MTVGEKIKERRLELGLTQNDLAKRMGYKTKSTICEVEKPGSNITYDRLVRFAEALNVTPAYLLDIDEDNLDYITKDEILLIERYRESDETTKKMVKRILEYKEGIEKL